MEGEQDMKGWLLTCDQNRQKQALKDAYNFLTQYIEQVYDDLVGQAIQKKLKQENKQLSLESELKQCKKKQNRLLFSVETKVKCVIFVKINEKFKKVIDPILIVDKMMQDVYLRNKEVTRFCHKVLPVERAFKAEHFKMLDVVDELFNQKTRPGEVKSWSLNFKLRNNSKFDYKEVLRQCEKVASKYGHFADIYYPQWTLSIEIANHLMCMSLGQKYKEYNEYKLHKKVPKQQRPIRQQRQKNQAENKQRQIDLDEGLKTQKQLRQKLKCQQSNKNQQKAQYVQKKQQEKQNKEQNNQGQIKSPISNKKLLQQKIVANDQDDVDLF